MTVTSDKAGVIGLLGWVHTRFGFETGAVVDAIQKFASITPEGIKLKLKLPMGSADVLIVPEVGPNGSLNIRIVQIKVLGMGFLVKQLRAMAAKAILERLATYIDFFGSSLTTGNDILIFRADVKVTAVSYLLDSLTVVADLD